MTEHWMHDEELFNKHPKLKRDLINVLIGMKAVIDLDKDIFIKSRTEGNKVARSYLKGLSKSGIHAYMKRLCDFEEYRKPETLVAILQYEFQANMLLNKTEVPKSIKWYVEYVSWLIGSFRERWGIEPFEDTGLEIGWQCRCAFARCERYFFALEIPDKCPSCGADQIEINEICTVPFGHEVKNGYIIKDKFGGFAPSNGSEEKAIMSIKKILGVEDGKIYNKT